ncbi:hypothetical protein EPIR_0911 [Erwinia piriflorinigrans CFBP 5888]|uniref:Uncharacterized protein n=1 Tax=Erwinia piriflorinigrans CFBP 5888 TaxID=1161919 RepID=V5Z4M5_9GAMM|nr:hypothetical protein EPIR_0911 [Erwinia piriflorinigrans CFBP 5888]
MVLSWLINNHDKQQKWAAGPFLCIKAAKTQLKMAFWL